MDIIFQLGGNSIRASKAAKLAVQYPQAFVVISSEIGDHGLSYYDAAGVNRDRITVDMQAWDTVTNFTHTYKLLRRLGITRLLVVTDSSHMPRSLAIAEQVWGGRVPIESHPFDDGNGYLEADRAHLKADKWRGWLWRRLGILVYAKSVYNARKEYFKQIETHSLIEIGLP
jgi:uncharacterized SAM-binding protein YcdF (DUF218 family)